jgi:dTDP-4-amino-4,6-dideoxygalactose transaminase
LLDLILNETENRRDNDVHKIPMLDLTPEIESIRGELMNAITGVLNSGHFIMGPNVKAFEKEVAQFLGGQHAISVNSGTDALVIGLRAAGIGEGDEVITTSFTFFATAEAIEQVGATPVFVDVNPIDLNLDVEKIEAAITARTKAILPVHLYGQAANMEGILSLAQRYELKVIEDVAQSFGGEYRGQKLGTLGDVGCYSFFPSKNLGAYGDGGLILTNDENMAAEANMLRVHGTKKKYYNEKVGYNSRLDEIQAAILRIKLARIQEWNEGRRRAAAFYHQLLQKETNVATPTETPGTKHVYHQYTIRIKDGRRNEVQRRLSEKGIDSFVYYPVPVHQLPLYKKMNWNLPLAEEASKEVLSLPIWPQIDEEIQEFVVDALKEALK